MKINEFFNQKQDQELNFNVPEDVYTYMVNDPAFYRKHYYPAILRLPKEGNAKSILPVIDKACNQYVRKYNIPKEGMQLLTAEEKNDMARQIYAKEMKRHKKGKY